MLNELFLMVRPEEKQAVETALQTVVGPVYTIINALGRGAGGGLKYTGSRSRRLPLVRSSAQAAAFLPKVIFYLVVPSELTELVLQRVGGALRVCGGPDLFARGLAIVAPAVEEIEIGNQRQRAPEQINAQLSGSLAGARA